MIHLAISAALVFSAASSLQNVVLSVAHREHAWAWFGSLVFSAAVVAAGLNVACFLLERS